LINNFVSIVFEGVEIKMCVSVN